MNKTEIFFIFQLWILNIYKYYIICPTHLLMLVIKSYVFIPAASTFFLFYFFKFPFLINRPRSHASLASQTARCLNTFWPSVLHTSKHQTLTLRTDPPSRPARPTTEAPPHRNRRTAAIAAARRPKPKIRSKQISNLYVLHSLILSLPLFF